MLMTERQRDERAGTEAPVSFFCVAGTAETRERTVFRSGDEDGLVNHLIAFCISFSLENTRGSLRYGRSDKKDISDCRKYPISAFLYAVAHIAEG